jgi:hypothetical protein
MDLPAEKSIIIALLYYEHYIYHSQVILVKHALIKDISKMTADPPDNKC